MRLSVNSKRAGVKLATLVSVVAALFLMAATTAAAADTTENFNDSVVFIGDSVTAGFGYCGLRAGQERTAAAGSGDGELWNRGDNTLNDCTPPNPPELPNDACSNDNVQWQALADHPPGRAGPDSPSVAYPFQIAARQTKVRKAPQSPRLGHDRLDAGRLGPGRRRVRAEPGS